MASRRRGSSASRSRAGSRGAGHRPSSSRTSAPGQTAIKVRKDGKVSVRCPQCSASYAIPEDYLDERVKCKHCQMTFVPRVSLEKPARRKRGGSAVTKPLVNIALLGIAILVVIIIYNANQEAPKPVKAAPPRLPLLSTNSPMYIVFEEFADAIRSKNSLKVAQAVNLEQVYSDRKVKDEPPWHNLTQEKKAAWTDGFTKELFEDKKWEIFWIFEPLKPDDTVPIPKDCKSLEFNVTMNPLQDQWFVNGEILVRTDFVDGVWKVSRWDIKKDPRPPGWGKKKKKAHGYHKKLGKPGAKTITDADGQKQTRAFIEPQPLDHLEDTPPELRKEIDQAIERIMDPDEVPKVFKASMRRLVEIGKPAIPRLLTKFYEVKGSTEDERIALRLVVDVLRDITGESFGYTPSKFDASNQQRKAALGFWFGWWSKNWWRDDFRAHEQDEEIPIPPPTKRGIKRTPKKPPKQKK